MPKVEMKTRYLGYADCYIDLDSRKMEDLISNITAAFEKVPVECRDSARISFEGDYDSVPVSAMITYESPVTDAEREEEARKKEIYDDIQRRQYEALKKIYG